MKRLTNPPAAAAARLQRSLGLGSAVLTGLGAILGTGIFVSIGVAAGVAGSAVVPAIALAACVALCNALSSAQLAAAHPVSGGTYEYGYRWLSPRLGFTAGWMFLCAKSASAATAALGFAGYVLTAVGAANAWRTPLALATVVTVTVLVLTGLRSSARANGLIVGITLLALVALVVAGLPTLIAQGVPDFLHPAIAGHTVGLAGLLNATALMFVAFTGTGYGRIATMGEEVRTPRRTIPRAIVVTLAVSALLYLAVAAVAVATLGAGPLAAAAGEQAAPLQRVAALLAAPGLTGLVAIGGMTAMLGVLLNLLLGLSRVLLAMGRRGDMPGVFARLDPAGVTPHAAVCGIGVLALGLTAVGRVQTTWSFSAFTVLVYYALTNAAALRLPPAARRYPRLFSWLGLAACLLLAFWVDTAIWLAGLGVLAAGLLWQALAAARRAAP